MIKALVELCRAAKGLCHRCIKAASDASRGWQLSTQSGRSLQLANGQLAGFYFRTSSYLRIPDLHQVEAWLIGIQVIRTILTHWMALVSFTLNGLFMSRFFLKKFPSQNLMIEMAHDEARHDE